MDLAVENFSWITRNKGSIIKLLRSPGIDSNELIPPTYEARQAGTKNRVVVLARQDGNRFLSSLKDLQIRALVGYNPFPTRFLGPIDCSGTIIQVHRFSG
jgi:hypothetical protein